MEKYIQDYVYNMSCAQMFRREYLLEKDEKKKGQSKQRWQVCLETAQNINREAKEWVKKKSQQRYILG